MFKDMLNRPLKRIILKKDGSKISFIFKDGYRKILETYADCCSRTWIEHLERPDNIDGAIIFDIKSSSAIPWDNHRCDEEIDWKRKCGHDHLQVYNTKFATSRGDIVIEYRNDSNGYYGGCLRDNEGEEC